MLLAAGEVLLRGTVAEVIEGAEGKLFTVETKPATTSLLATRLSAVCAHASSPSEKQGERNGAGQAAQAEPTAPAPRPVPEPTALTGAPGDVSDEERVVRAKADCRLATHVAEEGMSPREADAFSQLLADMVRSIEDPTWALGELRNTALDHLGVPRYPECKAGEE